MESSSAVVVKVKYEDVLRRFNAKVVDKELNLSMDGLREKIVSLFSFAPNTELMLTYIDEDNDVVNLVDDDDIRDVFRQGLNPLRITVKVNSGKNGEQYTCLSESSTLLRSPRGKQPMQNLHTGVSAILRNWPEPLRETVVKLSTDLASKTSSSAPFIGELVDCLSKVGLSYLGQLSESQPGLQSRTLGGVSRSTDATETKDSGLSKVPATASVTLPVKRSDLSSNNNEGLEGLKPVAALENEVRTTSVTGGRKDGSLFDCSAVAAALESQNMNIPLPNNKSLPSRVQVHPKSDVSHNGKTEKFKKIVEMSPLPSVVCNGGETVESCSTVYNLPSGKNRVTIAEVAHNPNEPKVESNHANIGFSDPRTGENINVKGRSALCDGVGKSSGSILASGAMNGCSFSGIAVDNVSAVPPHSSFEAISSRRSRGQNDGCQYIVHHGIGCDGCDVYPITGPRFKSKVRVDYDLCNTCFGKMGNDTDYIRMDFPVVRGHHMPYIGGLYDIRARDQGQVLPQIYSDCKVKPVAIRLDSCFVEDVNIIDGSVMAPLTPFTKIWRMRNNGTVGWLQGTRLVWVGGDKLGSTLSIELKIPRGGVWMNQELDVMVDFISPESPGQYISNWRMATASGEKFGQRVWVIIRVVDASTKKIPHETVRNLNLNLPPMGNCLDGPEIINVEPEPVVRGVHWEPDNSKQIVELLQPETKQDLKFPINDSLLVGNVASAFVPFSTSSVSYPVIDVADVSPVLPFLPTTRTLSPQIKSKASVATSSHSAVDNLPEKHQFEEKLLRELDEMGFRKVDLNKANLAMNEYNLEKAVDDLCDGTDWDSFLDELEAMGFDDRELNKKMLKKNNGSIERVVMDLVAGEMN